jgi:hypothetical protein
MQILPPILTPLGREAENWDTEDCTAVSAAPDLSGLFEFEAKKR